MSEKKSKKSEQKRTFKPLRNRAPADSKSDGEPKLYFGSDKDNFAHYRKMLTRKVLVLYDDLGKLVIDGKYFVPPEIEPPDLERFEGMDRSMTFAEQADFDTTMMTHNERVKARLRRILKMEEKKTSMSLVKKIIKETVKNKTVKKFKEI